jgi:LacI family transcriptional regulator
MNTPVSPEIAGRIYIDEVRSVSMAVNHLVKGGRRHLGYVGFDITTYARRERYRGFELALKNAGLDFDPETQVANIPNTPAAIDQALDYLLHAHPRIDGLICYNDGIAARALHSCAGLGLHVPDDVAVIGYDDIFLSDLITPPLTTLDLKITKQEVGALAARMLLERIANDGIQQGDVILNHQLIVRGSAP